MAKDADRVSTSEFSALSGIPTSTVSKLIREKRIRATKQAGKWMILKSQLKSKAVLELKAKGKKKPSPKKSVKPAKAKTAAKKTPKAAKKPAAKKQKAAPAKKQTSTPKPKTPAAKTKTVEKKAVKSEPKAKSAPKPAGKSYSIEEFSQMTYLTEFGVTDWLKKGFLTGNKGQNGQWQVHASSLELSRMKKLIR